MRGRKGNILKKIMPRHIERECDTKETYWTPAIMILVLFLFSYFIWSAWKSWKTVQDKKKPVPALHAALHAPHAPHAPSVPSLTYNREVPLALANVESQSNSAVVTPKYGPLTGNPQSDTWKLFTPDSIVRIKNIKTGLSLAHKAQEGLVATSIQEPNIPATNYVRTYTWKVETSPYVLGALRLKNTYSALYLGFRDGRYVLLPNDGGLLTSLWATTANFVHGRNTEGICLFEATTTARLHGPPNFATSAADPLTPWSPVLLNLPGREFHRRQVSEHVKMDACTWETQLITRVHLHPDIPYSVPTQVETPCSSVPTSTPGVTPLVQEESTLSDLERDILEGTSLFSKSESVSEEMAKRELVQKELQRHTLQGGEKPLEIPKQFEAYQKHFHPFGL